MYNNTMIQYTFETKYCCKNRVQSLQKKKETKKYILKFTIEFILNCASFILICVLNQDKYVKETNAI